MVALGVGATIMAVPRALSGIVAVPQEAEPGISRAAGATPSAKPSTAKMPVWSESAAKSTSAADTKPPTAVTGLHLLANTETSISIGWDPAKDNVAVKLYVVKGDGFGSVQTSATKATVPWAHRTSTVTILVSAVDTSGNQSEWRSIAVAPPAVAANAPATTAMAASTTNAPVAPTTQPASTASAATTTAAATQSTSVQQTAATLGASATMSQSV